MSSKLDQTVAYIESLPIGTKVSIKSIAQTLSISEGTAYNAIKRAEQGGLVVSTPKAGTTRIQAKSEVDFAPITLDRLQRLTDATVLSGDGGADFLLQRYCVGDDSVDALCERLRRDTSVALCIVGNRMDVQMAALTCGAHLLLTDAAEPAASVLDQAAAVGGVIMQTGMSTFHVLQLLHISLGGNLQGAEPVLVREWMQPPQVLYLDSLVIDSGRIFGEYAMAEIPVVDGGMRICGQLNALSASRLEPSQRIEWVYRRECTLPTVQETDTMASIADLLRQSHTSPILVLSGEQLMGMLTAREAMRYFQYYGASSGLPAASLSVNLIMQLQQEGKDVYAVSPQELKSSGSLAENTIISFMLTVANKYCTDHKINGGLQLLTFNVLKPIADLHDAFLSIACVSGAGSSCILDMELYTDDDSYARASLVVQSMAR